MTVQKKIQEVLDARNLLDVYGKFPGQHLAEKPEAREALEAAELEAASLEPDYAKIVNEMNEQNKYNARMKIEDFVKRADDPRGDDVHSANIQKTVDALVTRLRRKVEFNDAADICNAVAARASDANIRMFSYKPLSDAEIAVLRSKLSFYGRGGGRRKKRRTGKKAKGKKRNSRTIKRNKK
jgi:hypothetical protein